MATSLSSAAADSWCVASGLPSASPPTGAPLPAAAPAPAPSASEGCRLLSRRIGTVTDTRVRVPRLPTGQTGSLGPQIRERMASTEHVGGVKFPNLVRTAGLQVGVRTLRHLHRALCGTGGAVVCVCVSTCRSVENAVHACLSRRGAAGRDTSTRCYTHASQRPFATPSYPAYRTQHASLGTAPCTSWLCPYCRNVPRVELCDARWHRVVCTCVRALITSRT